MPSQGPNAVDETRLNQSAENDTSLRALIDELEWYHTVEVRPGLITPGWFDTRGLPERLPFPSSMTGMRCLDIGTFDGFWAFEMERRGADEVTAVDVLDPLGWDWPAGSEPAVADALNRRKRGGAGFRVLRDAFGSKVMQLERSVYDLDPKVDGQFDFVYLGSLLLHLRDPVGALARVRLVTRGQLLVMDAIDLPLSVLLPRRPVAYLDAVGRPWWWRSNQAALARMLQAAGFELARAPQRVLVAPGPAHPRPALGDRRTWRALLHRVGRETVFAARFGAPHSALLARPAAG
jgi:tRNA (mo5U34)-methyltransferase